VQEQLRDVLVGTGVRVTDLFNAWDYNGNGEISRREFKQALTLLGMGQAPADEIHAIFDSFDLEG
jgi:Ca2+-binding EF-hand superfamily protein